MEIFDSLKLQEACKNAVKETNRCIKLNALNPHTYDIKGQQLEVKALFKTWICKLARIHIGYSKTNFIFDVSKFTITQDPETGNIIGIQLPKLTFYSWEKDDIGLVVSQIFKDLDYKSLFYEPELVGSYKIDQYSRQVTIINEMQRNSKSVEELTSAFNNLK